MSIQEDNRFRTATWISKRRYRRNGTEIGVPLPADELPVVRHAIHVVRYGRTTLRQYQSLCSPCWETSPQLERTDFNLTSWRPQPGPLHRLLGPHYKGVDADEIEQRIRDGRLLPVGLGWLVIAPTGPFYGWAASSTAVLRRIDIKVSRFRLLSLSRWRSRRRALQSLMRPQPPLRQHRRPYSWIAPRYHYRSATQWLGGMGVTMLGLLIFPSSVGGGYVTG